MIPLSQLCPGVRSTGDNLVFEVQSDSRPSLWHRVDLAATSGFGSCSCEKFTMNLCKKIRKATYPGAVLECPHIRAARRYLAIAVAQRLIQMRSGQKDPKLTRYEWGLPPW